MVDGVRSLVLVIWPQTDPVRAKTPIFKIFARRASAVAKKFN